MVMRLAVFGTVFLIGCSTSDIAPAPAGDSAIEEDSSSADDTGSDSSNPADTMTTTSDSAADTRADSMPIPDASKCTAPSVACGAACVDTSTDAKNCGRCGHDCLGGACTSGICRHVTLAASLDSPAALAVNATDVFVGGVNGLVGVSLQRISKAGWTITPIASSVVAYSLSTDSTHLYVGDNSSLRRVPLGGGTLTAFAAMPCARLAHDAMGFACGALDSAGALRTSGPTGSPVTVVLSNQVYPAPVLDGATIYFGTRSLPSTPGGLHSVPRAGGTRTTLVSAGTVDAVAVDATSIYWVDDKGALFRRDKGASANVALMPAVTDFFTDRSRLAMDASGVYVATGSYSAARGRVRRVARTGGPVEVIADLTDQPMDIAVDDARVYWVVSNKASVKGSLQAAAK